MFSLYPFEYDLDSEFVNYAEALPTFFEPAYREINRAIVQWLQPHYKDLKLPRKECTLMKLAELQREKGNGQTKLTPAQLILVDQLLRALKPFQEMRENAFKSKPYMCGDIMRNLLCWESELEKHGDEISTSLLSEIKRVKANLLKNNQFLAAIYLDPQFNNCNSKILSEKQKMQMLNYLIQVYIGIRRVEVTGTQKYNEECDWDEEPDWEENWNWDDNLDEDEEDEEVLRKESKVLQKSLKKLESQPEPTPEINIVEYWQTNTNAKLKKLANVVLAHPVSMGPIRSDFTFDPKMLISNNKADLNNLMKMYVGYTVDM